METAVALAIGALIGLYFLRQYFRGGVCRSLRRLDGKTVVITGANAGIGKETALDLAKRGARVVMCCRNMDKANKAAEDIRMATKAKVVVIHLNLASLKSIRDCAKEILSQETRIDVLINNAGVILQDEDKTEDGFELHIGVNHLGHFLLTHLLLDRIKESGPGSRIVNVSSLAHEYAKKALDLDDLHFRQRPYNRFRAYAQSKVANVIFTKELARRLNGTGVTTYAVHPGAIPTEGSSSIAKKPWMLPLVLISPLMKFCLKTPRDGAQTSIFCAVDPVVGKESGRYYADCREKAPLEKTQDLGLAKRLWELSEKEVGLA